jgi:deoxyribodipyrimidine photolyase-like uncharacterized protein
VPKQDGQTVNVALERSSQGREEGPMESGAVHALEHVMVGAVMAMCVHVAPAQVGLWFNEEIESA